MPETAWCLQQQPAPSIAQFATGQLDEDVFEIGGAMDVAQAVRIGQSGEQFARVAAIEKGGFAAGFDTLSEVFLFFDENVQLTVGFVENLDNLPR